MCRRAKDHSSREVNASFRRAKESILNKFQVCAEICMRNRLLHNVQVNQDMKGIIVWSKKRISNYSKELTD